MNIARKNIMSDIIRDIMNLSRKIHYLHITGGWRYAHLFPNVQFGQYRQFSRDLSEMAEAVASTGFLSGAGKSNRTFYNDILLRSKQIPKKEICLRLVANVVTSDALDFSCMGLGEWDLLYIIGLNFLRLRGISSILSTFSVLQFSLFSSPLASFGLACALSSVELVILNLFISNSSCAIAAIVVVVASLCVVNSASSSSSFTCEHEEEHRASRIRVRIKIQREGMREMF